MFATIQSKLTLALFVVILVIGGISGLYFWYSQKKIDTLQENNAKLETAVKEQKETIETIVKTVKNQNQQLLTLQNGVSAAEARRRDLEAMIQQMDIHALDKKDRLGLETELNKETNDMFNNMNRLTIPGTVFVPNTPGNTPPPTDKKPSPNTSNQPPPRPPAGKTK